MVRPAFVVGADGCKNGAWAAFRLFDDGRVEADWFADTTALWAACRDARLILLDVPIGLADDGPRACDQAARRFIAPRSSSVFPAPNRWWLNCPDLASADAEKKRRTGANKKVVRQTFAILPRIREVDDLLRSDALARERIRECHPEVCFRGLADGPLQHPKRHAEGVELRRRILARFVPELDRVLQDASIVFEGRSVADDDVLDALVSAVCAAGPESERRTLPEKPPRDACGLPMEMVYRVPARATEA